MIHQILKNLNNYNIILWRIIQYERLPGCDVSAFYIYIYLKLFDSLLHSADCKTANNEKNYCTIMSVTGKKN